ncbi:glycosyltransferase family 61 protein [Brucella rhizosphaerae]|uniref:glycosyltransferase family 61 protein n=1 Tax=Brucella rhizosphaerae TaxID=571254 RepID=UPI0004B1C4A2|nr:glycosyltransferase family 61 protein [Brucella rhizosphaerae]
MNQLLYRAVRGLSRHLNVTNKNWIGTDDENIAFFDERHPSTCFDAIWYRKKYSAEIGSNEDAWGHYVRVGSQLKFDPCEYFWPEWYLERNPDVAAASLNPLMHFEQYGAMECRDPSPLFQTGWYARTYNLDPKVCNPLSDFLKRGRGLGYAPRADLVVKSFMQGASNAGHASSLVDQIEWKLEHAGHSALYEAVLATGRSYYTSKALDITEQPFLQEIANEMQSQGVVKVGPPYSIIMDNVVIIPGSMFLAKESMLINDEVANLPPGSSLKLWDRTWRRGNNILLRYTVGLNPRIETGIHLFKEYEQNYFHFVAEVLPKLLCYERLGLDVSIPLLVSSDLDERLYELIEMFKHPQRTVLKLERNVPYLVAKLYYISDLSLVSDVYDRPPVASDTYLSGTLLNDIAVQALSKRTTPSVIRRRRKIFITRHGKRRKIVNEPEIVDALIRQGFEVIDLSNLSVMSQVELFSSADVIVGGTGAGFTNLLWCLPGTKAVILYPIHPFSNTTFWDRIAAVRKLNIDYIYGVRANVVDGIHSMHDDFTIDLEELNDAL